MNNELILKVEGLQTCFQMGKTITRAVNGVDFSLRRSKTLGIVGESGCGKSVTAHSVLQLLPKTGNIVAGRISYLPIPGGDPLDLATFEPNSKDMRAIRGKEIAIIFQDSMSSLNPVYSIGNQIVEHLLKHEKITATAARERVEGLLGRLGLPQPDKNYNRYPHEFSGGMKQRVMIAIAMICNPNILIADEPTTALDVTIQAQILLLMKELQQDFGTSIILITHDMGIVAEMCDDVAVMYMGRIVESGTLEQVFTNPLHPYTRALLKSVPVLGMKDKHRLETIEGSAPDAATDFSCCEFEPRCSEVFEACRKGFPPLSTPEPGHTVRCELLARESGL